MITLEMFVSRRVTAQPSPKILCGLTNVIARAHGGRALILILTGEGAN